MYSIIFSLIMMFVLHHLILMHKEKLCKVKQAKKEHRTPKNIQKYLCGNGILLPKLFWPTVRKNCSSDRENLLKFEAEGQEIAKNFKTWVFSLLLCFSSHFCTSFWPTKLRKYYVIVWLLFHYSIIFLNFCLACLALQDAKRNAWKWKFQSYFLHFGSFDEKRTYKNM